MWGVFCDSESEPAVSAVVTCWLAILYITTIHIDTLPINSSLSHLSQRSSNQKQSDN